MGAPPGGEPATGRATEHPPVEGTDPGPAVVRTRGELLVAARDTTGPLINGLLSQVPDIDPEETGEWIESFDGLVDERGGPRARYVLLNLLRRARERNVAVPTSLNTPYVNTIAVHNEPYFPGDEAIERRYRRLIRWNAAVMVVRANSAAEGIGGHLSTFASWEPRLSLARNAVHVRSRDGRREADLRLPRAFQES